MSCDSNLTVLSRSDAAIFADGTFKSCLNLWTVCHSCACVNEQCILLVFCIMTPGKSDELYIRIWATVRERSTVLRLNFQPISANFDYEIAIMNGLRKFVPSVAVHYWWFLPCMDSLYGAIYRVLVWRNISSLKMKLATGCIYLTTTIFSTRWGYWCIL